MERLSDEPEYGLPEQGGLAYLIMYLSEIGEAQPTGEGIRANSWQDLKAWSELMGITLSPGEANTLRTLSGAYVSEYYKADNKDCCPPCVQAPEESVVEGKIKTLFAMLRSQKNVN